MKKWLKRIGLSVLVLVILFVVVGLMLPNDYRVSRTVRINAPLEAIHLYVGDLNRWDHWTPWKEGDPTIVTTIGDKAVGVGANQTWTDQSGGGALTFTASSPDKGIDFDLSFNEGQWKCKAGVGYETKGKEVAVTWWMTGKASVPVIGGYFARMMDGMVGPMFDRGLELLKEKAEQVDVKTD